MWNVCEPQEGSIFISRILHLVVNFESQRILDQIVVLLDVHTKLFHEPTVFPSQITRTSLKGQPNFLTEQSAKAVETFRVKVVVETTTDHCFPGSEQAT